MSGCQVNAQWIRVISSTWLLPNPTIWGKHGTRWGNTPALDTSAAQTWECNFQMAQNLITGSSSYFPNILFYIYLDFNQNRRYRLFKKSGTWTSGSAPCVFFALKKGAIRWHLCVTSKECSKLVSKSSCQRQDKKSTTEKPLKNSLFYDISITLRKNRFQYVMAWPFFKTFSHMTSQLMYTPTKLEMIKKKMTKASGSGHFKG